MTDFMDMTTFNPMTAPNPYRRGRTSTKELVMSVESPWNAACHPTS